jgi:hypothetical protein
MSKQSKVMVAILLIAVFALSVVAGVAAEAKTKPVVKAAAKPAGCPAKVSQLSGCISSVNPAKSTLVLDCNGIKHNVAIAKGAKITVANKAMKLKDLKPGTKVIVSGGCSTANAKIFQASQVCQCETPKPKAKANAKKK